MASQIKCGKCKGYHATVAAVKVCCGTTATAPARFTEADEREMQRMEAEGDRAETRRDEAAKWAHKSRVETAAQREVDLRPASREAIHELTELLATKVAPEHERRYAQAVKELLQRGNATGFAVRSAIARITPWDNVRAGGGRPSAGHKPDQGQWSAADREYAQARRAQSKAVEREGLYRLSRAVHCDDQDFQSGALFQVVRTKDGRNLYAKLVTFLPDVKGKRVRPRLDYVRGMVFNLQDAELLPLEEAEELTRKTGWCVFGHFLTDPKSIARGMGPKCYERYPHLARDAA